MKRLFTFFLLILSLNISAQQYQKLFDFNGANGSTPWGSLITDGAYLYGMTEWGGDYDSGVVFKIKLDGTGYTKLVDFNGVNGANPTGTLLLDSNYLYGMTAHGGHYLDANGNGRGLIFRVKTDGTSYDTLFNFKRTTGYDANGTLIKVGTYLYGSTYQGGTYGAQSGDGGYGVIFKIKPDGTGFDTLLNFNPTNVGNPTGTLLSDGIYLYGMMGIGSSGSIFKIKLDGTNFANLYSSSDSYNLFGPRGGFIADSTYLYGMGESNVFKIKPDGTGYQSLWNTSLYQGGYWGNLLSDGTYLYGQSQSGGFGIPYPGGYIFKVKPDGTGFQYVHTFETVSVGTGGSTPIANGIINGGYLYGMTNIGGLYGKGVIYRLNLACNDTTINDTVIVCNSYTFNSHTYTVTGTYSDTLHSTLGCDSIIVTHLTVNSSPNVNYTLVASATPHVWNITPNITGGSFPYVYNWSWGDGTSANQTAYSSHTYSTVGGYSVCLNVTDNNGCSNQYCQSNALDSMIQINIYPCFITVNDSVMTCGNSYTFNNHIYSASGIYNDTLHSPFGCDSIIITHLTIDTIYVSFTLMATATPHQWEIVPSISGGIPPYGYIWFWGDSTYTYDTLYTSHTYTTAANYQICFVVLDNPGCYTTYCQNDSLYRASQSNQIVQINVTNGNTSDITQISNQNTFTIYPNPTSSSIHITGITSQNEIKIYDVLGNEILQSKQANIDVSSLPSAVYFVRVGTSTQKFIKQ